VGIFEQTAPPLPPELPRDPEWLAPPDDVVPAAFPLQLVLARGDEVAILVHGGLAYPTGFGFSFALRRRRGGQDENDPIHAWHEVAREGAIPAEALRFGIQFADGGKATVFDHARLFRSRERPPGPALVQRGGTGSGRGWDLEFWVWPLPPEGPVAFVCEWPLYQLELRRQVIDAAVIREAAAKARRLWPQEQQ
jgi:hypothetical protein